jgi:hypothetical protein
MSRDQWAARGNPLLRRPSHQSGDSAAEGSSRLRADESAALPDLIRQCLLRPPQPDGLSVAQLGAPESRALRRARVTHGLEPWEDLIAVWQWSKTSGVVGARPSSLIFTGRDIRIAEPRLRLAIAYETFGAHEFRYEYTPGGVHLGPDVFELVIDGPTPWRSPNAYQDAEMIADGLNRIKALAASAFSQQHRP